MLLESIEKLNEDIEVAMGQLKHDQTIQEIQNAAIIALERKLTLMDQNLTTDENKNLTSAESDATANGSVKFHLGDTLEMEDRILSTTVVKLSTTCSMLSEQVKQLQDSMRQLVQGLSFFCNQSQDRIEEILFKTCTTQKCIKVTRSTQTATVSRPISMPRTVTLETVSKSMSKPPMMEAVFKPVSNTVLVDPKSILLHKKKSLHSKLHISKSLHSSKQTHC